MASLELYLNTEKALIRKDFNSGQFDSKIFILPARGENVRKKFQVI